SPVWPTHGAPRAPPRLFRPLPPLGAHGIPAEALLHPLSSTAPPFPRGLGIFQHLADGFTEALSVAARHEIPVVTMANQIAGAVANVVSDHRSPHGERLRDGQPERFA